MKKTIFLFLFFIYSINLSAQSEGKELFINNCSFCHSVEVVQNSEDLLAPTLGDLLSQLKHDYKTDKKIKKHINNFVMRPDETKANPHNVNKFGLMPSQDEVITKRDLNKIATWMIKEIKKK